MRTTRQINLRHPRHERIDRLDHRRRRRRQAEQCPASGRLRRFVTIGQQAIVADAIKLRDALQCITGFRRARNFGFLHSNRERLIALLDLLLTFVPASAQAWVKPRAPIICTCCGAVMTIVRTRIRSLFPVPIRPTAEGAC